MKRRNFVSAAGMLSVLLFGSESVSAISTRLRSDDEDEDEDDDEEDNHEERDDTEDDREDEDARPSPPVETVIHLSSGKPKAQHHALLNAKNLLADDTVPVENLVLLANGKGVRLYTPPTESNEFYNLITSLQERGVTFRACKNAMEALGLTENDLIDGVEPVPSGVGELARLQELDYGYIKAP